MSRQPKTLELSSMARIISYLGKKTGGRVKTISDALQCMETPDYLWMKKGLGNFIVYDTVRSGTLDDIRLLHRLKYELRAKCMTAGGGGNALHVAAQHNRQSHAMLLMDMGLKADKKHGTQGFSALEVALANGHLRLFHKLLKKTGRIDGETKKEFLHAALDDGATVVIPRHKNRDKIKLPVVKEILEKFGPFSPHDLERGLETAAKGAMKETFELFRKAGAAPSSRVPIHITGTSFQGFTSAAVLLFVHTHPRVWGILIDRYAENTDALFPP